MELVPLACEDVGSLVCDVFLCYVTFPCGVPRQEWYLIVSIPSLEVIKLEYILRLKIKRSDWLLANTCPQSANHCALF